MALRTAQFRELTPYEREVHAVIAESGNDVQVGDMVVMLGDCHEVTAIDDTRTAWFAHSSTLGFLPLFSHRPYRVLPRVSAGVV